MMKAFTHIIHPELIVPSRRHKHNNYKKNNRQVSIDTTKNQVYIYDKEDNESALNNTTKENTITN